MSHSVSKYDAALPCVVQVGFAGSRSLFDDPPADPDAVRQWHDTVLKHLVKSLDELHGKLELQGQHFLCGISQIACGADTLFTRACQARDIPQRIFLPQPVDDYLSATGSEGTPDFTPQQRSAAESLLASQHIIQQRVVSHSPDRGDRFRETNAEILRVSDLVVCLLREDAQGKAGGTNEFLQRAKAIGTPALEIRVAVENGQPVCRNQWHIAPNRRVVPTIPEPLHQLSLPEHVGKIPSSEEYCAPLKKLVSTQAKRQQNLFRYAAALIIATHIFATVFAAGALALHSAERHHSQLASGETSASPNDRNPLETGAMQGSPDDSEDRHAAKLHAESLTEQVIPWLLGIELVLLVVGFSVHQYLHHSKAAQIWANARVVAELARSIRAIHPRHVYFEHLFRLALPNRFRPLLRTLNVVHLRSTYGNRNDPWPSQRDKYLTHRIDDQIRFYWKALAIDERRLKLYQGLFM